MAAKQILKFQTMVNTRHLYVRWNYPRIYVCVIDLIDNIMYAYFLYFITPIYLVLIKKFQRLYYFVSYQFYFLTLSGLDEYKNNQKTLEALKDS